VDSLMLLDLTGVLWQLVLCELAHNIDATSRENDGRCFVELN
jgi:hypothetical protein